MGPRRNAVIKVLTPSVAPNKNPIIEKETSMMTRDVPYVHLPFAFSVRIIGKASYGATPSLASVYRATPLEIKNSPRMEKMILMSRPFGLVKYELYKFTVISEKLPTIKILNSVPMPTRARLSKYIRISAIKLVIIMNRPNPILRNPLAPKLNVVYGSVPKSARRKNDTAKLMKNVPISE